MNRIWNKNIERQKRMRDRGTKTELLKVKDPSTVDWVVLVDNNRTPVLVASFVSVKDVKRQSRYFWSVFETERACL